MDEDIELLLEDQNRVILKLVNILVESYHGYSTNELSLRINVTERSIQRYIRQLKDLVSQYNEEKDKNLQVDFERYNGVRLRSDSGSNFMDFKTYIWENDATIQIFRYVMFEEFYSVKKYSLAHFTSESAVRRSLKKIDQFLTLYNLSLKRNTFEIVGKEKDIRIVSYILGWVIFKGTSWPFDSIDQAKAYQAVDVFTEFFKLKLSIIQRKQMAYILAINWIRFRKKHFIEIEDNWLNYVDLTSLKSSLSFLTNFKEEYHIYEDSELYFYVLLLQMKAKIFDSAEFKKRVFRYHKARQSDVYLATELFMKQFSEEFMPVPKELQERFFITSFSAHLFCKTFKNIKVDIDGHQNLNELDYDYPVLKEKIYLFIESLQEKSNDDLFLEKNFLFQKYILLFSAIAPLNFYEPSIEIFLDSDLPLFVKKNIMTKISDRFKHDFNIVFLDTQQLMEADLILTNIPNIIDEEQRFTYRIHLFDFPFKSKDFIDLEIQLRQIIQKKTALL